MTVVRFSTRHLDAPWELPDAATLLSVSVRHLRRLIDKGKVKPIRVGGRVLIPANEMERLVVYGCG
jgi:excisionase family DNA binding protein